MTLSCRFKGGLIEWENEWRIRMAFRSLELKFTYEDFLLFPDDGKRHEIIDGDHFATPAPSLGINAFPKDF